MAVSSRIMGHGGTTRVAVLVVVLSLLVLDATAFFTERSSLIAIEDPEDTPSTIAVDLMHAHHVDSPYMQGLEWSLTMSERLQLSMANGKRRFLQATDVFTSPLESAAQEYVVEITVGTPARTFVALADTGSDLVWLQCTNSTCTDAECIEIPDQPFNPSASSSYMPLSCSSAPCADLNMTANEIACPESGICTYNYGYGDGVTTGEMADETFTLTFSNRSTTPVPGIAMGCGTDDETLSWNATDGLVGLGRGPLSFVSQLVASSIISHVFSYCLVDYSSATTQKSPLVLGSAGNITKSYTPLVPISLEYFSSFYYVNLEGITVNGDPISYPSGLFEFDNTTGSGGMIVDSGTTYTYLFDEAYSSFEIAIAELIMYPTVPAENNTGLTLCYDTATVSKPVFPVVGFQFENNVNLTLSTNNTFVLVDDAGTYCLAFAAGGPQIYGPSIYGNIAQSHFEIAFDVVNQQVGFGPDGC